MDNFSQEELQAFLTIAKDVARNAGSLLLEKGSREIIKDWDKDIKIEADVHTHDSIVSALQSQSTFSILSEENKTEINTSDEYMWVVDPLDGSLNFSRGIPLCAVSIGLEYKGEPILGVVYDFTTDTMYSGIVGMGAWCNEKVIHVSTTNEIAKSILMSGFPSETSFEAGLVAKHIDAIQSFKKMRLLGSASLSLAYVASGRADAYFERDIKIWDVSAGIALVKAAGGAVERGSSQVKNACTVFASNPLITSARELFW